jgi:putative lipoprotein
MYQLVSILICASLFSTFFGINTAAGGGNAASSRVTGTVNYLERVALPPTAVVKVRLVDVSRADAPAAIIFEQIIPTAGKQVPFFFKIPFDPSKIKANYAYAVQARIEEDGRLRFISDQHYAVITRNAPMHVDIILRPVNGDKSN